jgi:glycosyltransferase involved in cell wall biosynthesis
MWHVLDVGSTWLKEFAAALGPLVPSKFWSPEIRNFGRWEKWERVVQSPNPELEYTRFPLQRGYARFPIGDLLGIAPRLTEMLLRREPDPKSSTLICTTPFYAPVAERWPGRVVYYLTDLTAAYPGLNRRQIEALDRRMCRVADLICPNSWQTAGYLRRIAKADTKKIVVVPNATRESNLLSAPRQEPSPLPEDLADLPRPVVAVLGNLAFNMDWLFLREAVSRTRDFSWAFVGPTDMKIPDAAMRNARADLMKQGGRVRFTGPKPYGELCGYARSCDVAVLPYLMSEATFACSATRFYEHLAACRPMIATRAVEELLHKEPLLKLVDNAEQAERELRRLEARSFRDGYEETRWRASAAGTWEARAFAMVSALGKRRPVPEGQGERNFTLA